MDFQRAPHKEHHWLTANRIATTAKKISEACNLFLLETLETWKPENPETWKPGNMETGKPGNLATWKPRTRKFGNLETSNLETGKLGNLETWKHGNLETWKLGNLGVLGKLSRSDREVIRKALEAKMVQKTPRIRQESGQEGPL